MRQPYWKTYRFQTTYARLNVQMLGIYSDTQLSLSASESSDPGILSPVEMVYVGCCQGASLPE